MAVIAIMAVLAVTAIIAVIAIIAILFVCPASLGLDDGYGAVEHRVVPGGSLCRVEVYGASF